MLHMQVYCPPSPDAKKWHLVGHILFLQFTFPDCIATRPSLRVLNNQTKPEKLDTCRLWNDADVILCLLRHVTSLCVKEEDII